MTLIVETGIGVEGANSYVSIEKARKWATQRGITLVEDDTTLEAQMIDAAQAVDGMGPFKGEQAQPGIQGLEWPRTPGNMLPPGILSAQMLVVIDSDDVPRVIKPFQLILE